MMGFIGRVIAQTVVGKVVEKGLNKVVDRATDRALAAALKGGKHAVAAGKEKANKVVTRWRGKPLFEGNQVEQAPPARKELKIVHMQDSERQKYAAYYFATTYFSQQNTANVGEAEPGDAYIEIQSKNAIKDKIEAFECIVRTKAAYPQANMCELANVYSNLLFAAQLKDGEEARNAFAAAVAVKYKHKDTTFEKVIENFVKVLAKHKGTIDAATVDFKKGDFAKGVAAVIDVTKAAKPGFLEGLTRLQAGVRAGTEAAREARAKQGVTSPASRKE